MKKLTILLLMCVYGLSSSGMSITVHYCMSQLVGWEVSGKTSTLACPNCGMKKKGHKGCCHDEKKGIKTEKDQKNVESFLNLIKVSVALSNTDYSAFTSNCLSNTIKGLPFSNAPPNTQKVPIYIYNCVFRV